MASFSRNRSRYRLLNPPAQSATRPSFDGQGQVLGDTAVGAGPHERVLEDPADHPGTTVFGPAGDIQAVQGNGAAIKPVGAGQAVEQGRFPGAVGPDDSDEIPGRHIQ